MFFIYLFFMLHGHSPVVLIPTAYNSLRAWTSPLSSTSSCHQKIKEKKTNPELEVVHIRAVPTNSCTDSDGGNVCGSPTLWQALPSIISFIISPSNLRKKEHLIHFKTCKLGPSNLKRMLDIPIFGH